MTPHLSWQRVQTGILLGGLGALLSLVSVPGAAQVYSEDAVKATFLSRFARYVDWPPNLADSQQFTIAVLGADGVALELQRLLPGSPIDRRPVQVRKIRRLTEIGDAQMLYIGPARSNELRSAVAAITTRPVLLVTDDEHGLDAGAAVNFLLVDQRVRFEVSVLAAERAGLRISAELLSVAARVQGGRRQSEVGCAPAPVDARPAPSCDTSGMRGDIGGEGRRARVVDEKRPPLRLLAGSMASRAEDADRERKGAAP